LAALIIVWILTLRKSSDAIPKRRHPFLGGIDYRVDPDAKEIYRVYDLNRLSDWIDKFCRGALHAPMPVLNASRQRLAMRSSDLLCLFLRSLLLAALPFLKASWLREPTGNT
jgi:hypothetical protein